MNSLRRIFRRMTALYENIAMALDAVLANKLRSFLTTLGIIIGVATVIAMMSIVGGINNIVEDELGRIGANVFFVKRFPEMQISMDWRKFRSRPRISPADWRAIEERCPDVMFVSPEVWDGGKTVSFEGEKTNADVNQVGATSSYFRVNGYDLSEGRFFTDQEVQHRRRVAIVGLTVVEKLFPFQSPMGKKIRINNEPFTVIGVVEELGTMFGMDRDNLVIVPISRVLKSLSGHQRHHGPDITIAVQARQGASLPKVMDQVRAVLRIDRGLKPDKPDNFELETRDSIRDTYKAMTGSIFAAAIGIALISLLVGGIGIMNIMLVSVKERTREIGVRKALGARRRDILWQFLVEAMTLSISGGMIGMGIGIGGLKLAALYSDKLPITISSDSITMALVYSLAVGIFFGVYPARKAASLDPIDSLRYE